VDAHSEIAAVATPGEAPEVMQALLHTIDAQVDPERREAVAAFAKAFLRRLAPEEIVESGPQGLFGLVRSAFAFADSRGTQPSIVRVFDPDEGTDGYATVASSGSCRAATRAIASR
jgi:hypothetical protein